MTVSLNQGQQAGADAFFEFLMTDAPIFTISGSAGTGKTFLTKHLIGDVMKKYEASCRMIDMKPEFDEVVFTATTNKAAEVLEKALGVGVSTIHSFLGLKVKENYRTGKTELEKTKNYKIRHRKIVFIDECSMIDKELFKHIMDAFVKSKIVFVGDHAQMAPINESLSQLYLQVDPNHMAFLTEPVRNAGQPALVALCSQLRDTVETGIFKPMVEVEGVIEYLSDEDMMAGLHHYFQDMDPSCRVLAYTNQKVSDYNQFIREEVRGLPPLLTPGEVLVVNQAFMMGNLSLSVEREVTIHEVSELKENASFFGSTGRVFKYRDVSLSVGDTRTVIENIPVADDPEQVRRAVKDLASRREWGEYFDLKATFLDIQPKSACTVYKAQGSTYDAVFIDLKNIGSSYSAEQVARMLFVAVSRAKSNVYFYGQLHGSYHNSQGKPLWTQQTSWTPSAQTSSAKNETASMASLAS